MLQECRPLVLLTLFIFAASAMGERTGVVPYRWEEDAISWYSSAASIRTSNDSSYQDGELRIYYYPATNSFSAAFRRNTERVWEDHTPSAWAYVNWIESLRRRSQAIQNLNPSLVQVESLRISHDTQIETEAHPLNGLPVELEVTRVNLREARVRTRVGSTSNVEVLSGSQLRFQTSPQLQSEIAESTVLYANDSGFALSPVQIYRNIVPDSSVRKYLFRGAAVTAAAAGVVYSTLSDVYPAGVWDPSLITVGIMAASRTLWHYGGLVRAHSHATLFYDDGSGNFAGKLPLTAEMGAALERIRTGTPLPRDRATGPGIRIDVLAIEHDGVEHFFFPSIDEKHPLLMNWNYVIRALENPDRYFRFFRYSRGLLSGKVRLAEEAVVYRRQSGESKNAFLRRAFIGSPFCRVLVTLLSEHHSLQLDRSFLYDIVSEGGPRTSRQRSARALALRLLLGSEHVHQDMRTGAIASGALAPEAEMRRIALEHAITSQGIDRGIRHDVFMSAAVPTAPLSLRRRMARHLEENPFEASPEILAVLSRDPNFFVRQSAFRTMRSLAQVERIPTFAGRCWDLLRKVVVP